MPAYRWTYEQEERLHQVVQRHGSQWERIRCESFPRLSVAVIKNKHYRMRKDAAPAQEGELLKLLRACCE
ncbi:Myb-like DNA-binding domain-containing protein [Spironucleus salmonicida]|uniref:Myb-like DNA-binding domain-containing protein n=1 Tax=Spironucleus salmonicida TaxID=348837 RepID=A0A9P8LVV2_9EUKA|nr:Myb-like DNA-binding domain-containing protein [Spironucleus salmonicida]